MQQKWVMIVAFGFRDQKQKVLFLHGKCLAGIRYQGNRDWARNEIICLFQSFILWKVHINKNLTLQEFARHLINKNQGCIFFSGKHILFIVTSISCDRKWKAFWYYSLAQREFHQKYFQTPLTSQVLEIAKDISSFMYHVISFVPTHAQLRLQTGQSDSAHGKKSLLREEKNSPYNVDLI